MVEQNHGPDKEILMHIDEMFNRSIVAHNEIIAQVSMFTIRWLVIMNGSACIALLALIGNTWGKVAKIDFITAVLPSIVLFALACVAALSVAGGLYFNFFYIASALGLRQKQVIQQVQGKDYAELEPKIRRCSRKVIFFKWLAVIFAIISVVLFVLGGRLLYCNLNAVLET